MSTDAKLYEALGRKQAQIEHLDAQYGHLLAHFAKVINGEIETERVLINLTARSWSIAPKGESVGMPATINGIPECVAGVKLRPEPEPKPADQAA